MLYALEVLLGMLWVTNLMELVYQSIMSKLTNFNIASYLSMIGKFFSILSVISGPAAVIAVFLALKNLEGQERQIEQAEVQRESQFEYSKKRDRQYNIQNSILNKTAQGLEYYLRRDSFQRALIAAANNIHSWCRIGKPFTKGCQIFMGNGIPDGKYECMMEWELHYRDIDNNDNTYQFCARFVVANKGIISDQFKSGKLSRNFLKENTMYELSIHRIDGHYGVFADRGDVSFLHIPDDIFEIICDAVSSVQALSKEQLKEACED